MTLFDDMKVSLRVTSDKQDSEVRGLIGAARFDMERAGVDPALLALDPLSQDLANELVKQAVRCYCKAHFGFDNAESERLDASYRQIVNDLLNSQHNVAAIAAESSDGASGESDGASEETSGESSEGDGE